MGHNTTFLGRMEKNSIGNRTKIAGFFRRTFNASVFTKTNPFFCSYNLFMRRRFHFFLFLWLFWHLPTYSQEPYDPVEVNPLKDEFRWSHLEFLDDYKVVALDASNADKWWFLCEGGLLEYNGWDHTFHEIDTGILERSERWSIHVASNGALYFLTNQLVGRLQNDQFQVLFIPKGLILSTGSRIAESPDGAIWFALNEGLFCYTKGLFEPIENFTQNTSSVVVDINGYLWVSHAEKPSIEVFEVLANHSIARHPQKTIRFDDIENPNIEMKMGASGRIWIALNYHFANFRVFENGAIRNPFPDHSRHVVGSNRDFCEDPYGNLRILSQRTMLTLKTDGSLHKTKYEFYIPNSSPFISTVSVKQASHRRKS